MEVDDTHVPSRAEVETHWVALAEGSTTREAVHTWTAWWVEHTNATIEDPMVWSALVRLHGFDMTALPETPNRITHGGAGRYVHPDAHIVKELARWRAMCREYDDDPAAWAAKVRRQAERHRSP
ncbi:hypothetical protein [Actinomadura sp. 9N407]|uniref:hypothetical protein n=1 Tax=Actinomadura sp. 9N407 TaxID=3375154 RepID=UPI0037B52985